MQWADFKKPTEPVAAPAPTADLTSAVGASALDRIDFAAAETINNARITDWGDRLGIEVEIPGSDLALDLYASFLRGDIELAEAADMASTHQVNHESMRRFLDTEGVQDLRTRTVADPTFAYYAAGHMRSALEALVREVAAEEKDDSDGTGPGDGTSEGQDAVQEAAEGLAKTFDDVNEQSSSFGLGSISNFEELPFNERKNVVDDLREHCSEVMKLLGQLNRVFVDRFGISDAPSGEIVDVVLGDDLTALTPEELLYMSLPETETLFWARWADRAVACYQQRDTDQTGRGPIIILGDESSSMSDHRMDWMKALAISFTQLARRENRQIRYIGYAGNTTPMIDPTSDAKEFYRMVTQNHGGGTNVAPALDMALAAVDQLGKGRADILLLSDGEFSVNHEWAEDFRTRRDAKNVRVLGVAIEASQTFDGFDLITTDSIPFEHLSASAIADLREKIQ